MTPLGLTVLRRTAALVHAVPGLRARLRHGDTLLLEVLRPVHPGSAPTGRWLTPCSFRVAVGRALEAVRDGRTLAVLGLAAGDDPAVDLCSTNGTLLSGGIARMPTPEGTELVFATTLPPERVAALTPAGDHDVRCHADPITQTSLVVYSTTSRPGSPEHDEVLEHAQALLARCAVDELVDDLAMFVGAP
jgi:hypothetical protein